MQLIRSDASGAEPHAQHSGLAIMSRNDRSSLATPSRRRMRKTELALPYSKFTNTDSPSGVQDGAAYRAPGFSSKIRQREPTKLWTASLGSSIESANIL